MRKHRPERVRVPLTPQDQRTFYFGNEIDRKARLRFPGGTTIESLSNDDALDQTRRALEDESVIVIFQGAFFAEPGFLARADILIREEDSWRLLEVKGVTDVKDEHVNDAAFQLHVLEATGLSVSTVSILHLDKKYRRYGVNDPLHFLIEQGVAERVTSKSAEIADKMIAALDRISDEVPPETCDCNLKTSSNHCLSFSNFHPSVPTEGSVYELRNVTASKLTKVLERGIIHLKDWPDDVALNDEQELQVRVLRTGTPWIDHAVLSSVLGDLAYPLYFLDYETSSVPIPMFEGAVPYQQVPFQYSLHIVERDGSRIHREYLATDFERHPVHGLVAQLRSDIGDGGSIMVWNKSFEGSAHKLMAELVTEHAEFLLGLNNRAVDLMETVSKGGYVHPGFRGSTSIKKVLPVIAPDLDYSSLSISEGSYASERWLACALGEVEPDAQAIVFQNLREYCHLDTLAMVRIWEFLRGISGTESCTNTDLAPAAVV